ncbi:MAG: MFS transporter [Negativicutes bacterium]|nr:MFS transporter [Negativicutes bacterium]
MNLSLPDQQKTNVRYFILVALFIVTVLNVTDRATLSVAAPAMRKELGMDAMSLGIAFSAFGWTYTAFQIPGGWLLDKYGSRLVYGVGLFLWSFFTLAQGFIGSFAAPLTALFIFRLLMGAAEAPAFPANSRLAAMWFPNHERGFASAVFNSAQYVTVAIFVPIMAVGVAKLGWPALFVLTGLVGIMMSFCWFKVIRDPKNHPRVNQAELDYIQTGGGLANLGEKRTKIKWAYVRALITNRLMVGVYLAQFCINTITWFFLTWFPTYLIEAKGMSILQVGLAASIPGIAGFGGGLLGGYWSDWLLRRGKTLTFARKTPIILGLVCSSSIILANYVDSEVVVIFVLAVAFFAKGLGSLGWSVVGDTSPKEMVGLSGGIFNMIGNLSGIVTPLVIGYILKTTGSFNGALMYVGALGFIGAMSYLFIVGEIKRVVLDTQEDDA